MGEKVERKLIVYETTHYENLSALLVLADRYFSAVTVFLPEDAYLQALFILKKTSLQTPIEWIIQKKESNRNFIRKFFWHIRQKVYTHIHINTLDHNMLYFTWHLLNLPEVNMSMTVHSLNEFTKIKYHSFRDITENIAHIILRKKIRRYRVLAPQMTDTAKNYFPDAFTCFIPGNFFFGGVKNYHPQEQRYFRIVIPGSVETKRRDYIFVIRFFEKYLDALSRIAPIQLTLAGNAHSEGAKGIVKSLKKLADDRFRFVYYSEPLPQDLFEDVFNQADVIWAPIKIRTYSLRGIAEVSSVTHSPGFITDQIYFGIPAIIPKGLVTHQRLTDCNFEYETEEELNHIFCQLLSDPTFKERAHINTKNACSYFVPDNFRDAFKDLMNL